MNSRDKSQILFPNPTQKEARVRPQCQLSKNNTSEEEKSHEHISTVLPPTFHMPPQCHHNDNTQHEDTQNKLLVPLSQKQGQEQTPEERYSSVQWNSYLRRPTASNKILPIGMQPPSRGLESVDPANTSLQKQQPMSLQLNKGKNSYGVPHEQNCALKLSSKQSNEEPMKHIKMTNKEKELLNETTNGHTIHTSWNDKPQIFLQGNLTGGWQSNKDLDDRSKIIFNIVNLFKQTRPKTDTEYHK
jgi:hypothetical protein